jgi:DNA-binding transcriptional ArsR family regulator
VNLPEFVLAGDAARTLTDRIKVGVEAVWDLVAQAYKGQAHTALGYGSWDEYVTREFGTGRIRLPREEREDVVQSLRDSGMSLRAIAAATGESKDTVARVLEGVSNETPDPTHNDPETGEIVDDPEPETKITGTDGKQYTARDQATVRARRKRIRELLQSGHSTSQIADIIGIDHSSVSYHIKAMGLTPLKANDKGGRRLGAGDGIEKFVTALSSFPVAVRTLRATEAATDERCAGWITDIDEAIKSLRSLRSELSKGAVNGHD